MEEQRQNPGGRSLPAAERPVFLASTGRRRTAMRLVARGSAVLTAGWLACVVVGSIGFLGFPHLGLPAQQPRIVARSAPRDRDVDDRGERRCGAAHVRLATVALAGHEHASVYRRPVARRARTAEPCESVRV